MWQFDFEVQITWDKESQNGSILNFCNEIQKYSRLEFLYQPIYILKIQQNVRVVAVNIKTPSYPSNPRKLFLQNLSSLYIAETTILWDRANSDKIGKLVTKKSNKSSITPVKIEFHYKKIIPWV